MLSILIPTLKNNQKYLDFCRESLEENTLRDFEILVGENGHGTDYPQGQCGAVNRIAKQAKGDWLLITNDDMYFPPAWDRNMKFVSECLSLNCNYTWDAVDGLNHVEMKAGDEPETFDKNRVDNFIPTNLIENGFTFPIIIKKTLWDKVGGYDENYDPWGSNSDSDLEYKVILSGVQPKILRGVFIYHFGMKSGTFNDPKAQECYRNNFTYFREKWGFDRVDTPRIQKADVVIDMDKLKFRPKWGIYE